MTHLAPWNDPTLAWVCEQHPERLFPHDDCAGPGMLNRDALAAAYQRGWDEAKEALAAAQARAEALQAELTEANRQADEEVRHLKNTLRAEREARERHEGVLRDSAAVLDLYTRGFAWDNAREQAARIRAALAAPGETKGE